MPIPLNSGWTYPPPFRVPDIDVDHATKQHQHRLRLPQQAAIDRPSTPFGAVFADFCDYLCRVWWTSSRCLWVHHYPELLSSLPFFARCSPLSPSLKSCQVTGGPNSQFPKPSTSCRDGGSAIAYHRSHFRRATVISVSCVKLHCAPPTPKHDSGNQAGSISCSHCARVPSTIYAIFSCCINTQNINNACFSSSHCATDSSSYRNSCHGCNFSNIRWATFTAT